MCCSHVAIKSGEFPVLMFVYCLYTKNAFLVIVSCMVHALSACNIKCLCETQHQSNCILHAFGNRCIQWLICGRIEACFASVTHRICVLFTSSIYLFNKTCHYNNSTTLRSRAILSLYERLKITCSANRNAFPDATNQVRKIYQHRIKSLVCTYESFQCNKNINKNVICVVALHPDVG